MKIAADKIGHLKAGMLIALVVSFYFDLKYGVFAAMFIGIGKEILDYLSNRRSKMLDLNPHHTVEFADIWFTALGGAIVVVSLGLIYG